MTVHSIAIMADFVSLASDHFLVNVQHDMGIITAELVNRHTVTISDFCRNPSECSWMHLLFSFCHIYCYTDKFRQLFVTTFVYRVNSVWGDELDSLGCGRLAHKVLIVDCTKLKRKFARSNRIPLTDCRCGYRRDNSRGKDEKFPYRSGPKWYEPFCVLSKELGPEVRRATESCSPMEPGTVVVKSNDGLESLDRDSYRDDQYWDSQELQFPSQLMDLALGYQKADRLIFWDSILPDINILEFLHSIYL